MLEGLRVLLEDYFDAVIMVADESSLYRAVDRLQPECAVVDISFPHLERASDSIISLLHQRIPGLALIALSVHDERVVAERALELGASGFVVKGTAVRDLLPAIDAVMRGEKFVSPSVHP
jgi:DNA-binding NarL/FixJ family response regulator